MNDSETDGLTGKKPTDDVPTTAEHRRQLIGIRERARSARESWGEQ